MDVNPQQQQPAAQALYGITCHHATKQFLAGGVPACSSLGQQLMEMAAWLDSTFTKMGESSTGAQVFDLIRGQVAIPSLPDFPCPVCQGHCTYY